MADPIRWYDAHASEVSSRYEAVKAETVHAWLVDLLPALPALILDVGAGSGRDAAWLWDGRAGRWQGRWHGAVMIMTPELNEGLRRDIEALLHQIGIARSYGWQNAYDADPDFIGHATWQTDAPLDDLFERESGSATRPDAPEWLKRIALEGTDFEGLMQAARISIGLFLRSSANRVGKTERILAS
jgi:hypothetical protein